METNHRNEIPADRRSIRHCGNCGAGNVRFDGEKIFSCPDCGWIFFKNPAAAVVAILEIDDCILFSRRARAPAVGLLDLPGGFIDTHETAEQALARELHEELDISPAISPAQYLGSLPNLYPFQGTLYDTIDLFYRIPLANPPTFFDTREITELVPLARHQIHLPDIGLPSIRRGIRKWVL